MHVQACLLKHVRRVQTLTGMPCASTQLQPGWLVEGRQDVLPCLSCTFGPACGFKLLVLEETAHVLNDSKERNEGISVYCLLYFI